MKGDLASLLAAVEAYLAPRAKQDPHLRELLRQAAAWLSSIAGPDDPATGSGGVSADDRASRAAGEALAQVSGVAAEQGVPDQEAPRRPGERAQALVPLKIGDTLVHVPVEGSTQEIGRARLAAQPPEEPERARPADAAGGPDLAVVARRARLKAQACPVAMRRRGLRAGDAALGDVLAEMNALIARAKSLPSCFLWQFFPEHPVPADEHLRTIERCYANLALAAELALRVEGNDDLEDVQREAIQALAEAQSALRVALGSSWLTRPDQDQEDAFLWLTVKTKRDQVFIERFMRLNDPADPALADELGQRLLELAADADRITRERRNVSALVNKVRFHAKRIVDAPTDDHAPDWAKIAEAIDRLNLAGVRPTDQRVTGALAPTAGVAEPASPTPALSAALMAASVARREPASEPEQQQRRYSATVERVRAWLHGARVVVVGGEVYDHARQRLTEALELGELDWVHLREHASSAPLEAAIARPDTRLVLALVKLAGHQHIDDARRWARQHGRPLVMVPGGYNPEQVAAEIAAQVSDRLEPAR